MNTGLKTLLVLLVTLLPIGLGSCASKQVTQSLDRTPLRVRVMSYNILEGGGECSVVDWGNGHETVAGNRRRHIVNQIRKIGADVVFLQECNGWEENDNRILNEITGELEMHAVIAPNHSAAKLSILSRYPIAWQRWLDDENIYAHNVLIAGLALSEDQTVQVVNVHFDWTAVPEWNQYDDGDDARAELYQQQCEILLAELQKSRYADMIVAGSLNHSPSQKLFEFTPLYRQILALGYVDMVELHNSYLYHRERTSAGGKVVDYIFGSSSLKGACRASTIVKAPRAYQVSDHLPLWAALDF